MMLISNFLVKNLSLVNLFQSIIFFIIGTVIWVTIWVVSDKTNRLEIVKALPFLAIYAIFTGFNRFFEFAYLDTQYIFLKNNLIIQVMHTVSYGVATVSLLLFGLILIKGKYKKSFIVAAIILLTILIIFSIYGLLAVQPLIIGLLFIRIADRYIITLPAFLLSGIAFLQLYKKTEDKKIARIYSYIAAIFFIDAVIFGFFPPEAPFFPANIINDKVFFEFFGLPIQIFRAAIAVIFTVFIIQSLRIFKIESAKKEQELTGQRMISSILQKSILPGELPEIKNHLIGRYYKSSTAEAEVGGDFYDFLKINNDKVGFTLGDVSGKGIQMASETSKVRDALSAYAFEESDPSKVIYRLNNYLVKNMRPGLFVTLLYIVYEPLSGFMEYVNAGHHYPLIFNRESENFRFLKHSDLVLGIYPNEQFVKKEEKLENKDILIGYTDGLVEASHNGDLFGEERFIKAIRNNIEKPVDEMPMAICEEAVSFAGNTLKDDVLLIAIERFKGKEVK